MIRNISILFLAFALIFVGCTKKDENVYQNAAKVCLAKQDVKGAVENYSKIAEEFPESSSAPKALYDIAGIYQNKMDITLDPTVSLKKAIDYFNKIIDKYPESKEAPLALFNIGFIQANDLQDFDGAKKSYGRFLHDYPNHELAASAKQEIEFMGVPPESLLPKKTASKK
jgi:TolA-binding protein